MRTLISVALLVASSTAGATTQHGPAAEVLTYALRYAGTAPIVAKGTRTFRAGDVECTKTLDPGGGLGELTCKVGTTEIKDAAAYLLYTALLGAGFPEWPVGDAKIQVTAEKLSCVQDPAKSDEQRFACTADHMRPDPVSITPKKVKVKEIVQPVKIEKQP